MAHSRTCYRDYLASSRSCVCFQPIFALNSRPVLAASVSACAALAAAAFGIVPANFRQVETPRVDCKALAKLTGGTQFVNTSDAGGVYNGQWIMATSRWVTRVYAPSKPLPRTGY